MFIETEGTPNPATLKFLPGRDVMGFSTADFASAASAVRSPLATGLFTLFFFVFPAPFVGAAQAAAKVLFG